MLWYQKKIYFSGYTKKVKHVNIWNYPEQLIEQKHKSKKQLQHSVIFLQTI